LLLVVVVAVVLVTGHLVPPVVAAVRAGIEHLLVHQAVGIPQRAYYLLHLEITALLSEQAA
jgi:hypothetical protein